MPITKPLNQEFEQDPERQSIADLLAMPEAAEIDFHPPRMDKLHEVPDLS